jgi:hypothetical protein
VSRAVGSHSTRAALAIPWPATQTGFAEPCRWCAHSTRDRVLRWEHFGRLRLRLEGRERGFVDCPHDSEVIGSGLIATPAATARCPHRTPEARGEDRLHCFVSLSNKGQSRENEANLPSRVSLAPHTPRRKVASGGLPRLVDKHPARARKFSREFRRAQLPDTPGGPERAR